MSLCSFPDLDSSLERVSLMASEEKRGVKDPVILPIEGSEEGPSASPQVSCSEPQDGTDMGDMGDTGMDSTVEWDSVDKRKSPGTTIFDGFEIPKSAHPGVSCSTPDTEDILLDALAALKLGDQPISVEVGGNMRSFSVVVSGDKRRKQYVVSEVESELPRLNRMLAVAGFVDKGKKRLLLNLTFVGPPKSTPEIILLGQWLSQCKRSTYLILYHPVNDNIMMTKQCTEDTLGWISHLGVQVNDKAVLVEKYVDFALHGKVDLKTHLGLTLNHAGHLESWVQRQEGMCHIQYPVEAYDLVICYPFYVIHHSFF
jgi:hypothetical protein